MLNRIGIIGAFLLCIITLSAQTNSLSTLQYWWNDDLPNSVQKTISGNPATLNETTDAASLLDGLHRLNYRIKDARGAWSQTVTTYFLKRTNLPTGTNALSTLEYWWNDNQTNAIQKAVSGNGLVEISEAGNTSSLLDGLHRLNYRIKDARGAWSQTVTSYFLKQTNLPTGTNALSTLEYWWDDDLANVNQKSVSGNGLVEISEIGNTSALLDGLHRLNYRVKDARGAWSQTVTSYFLKQTNLPTGTNALSTLEYWWDDDLASASQKSISGNGLLEISETGNPSALLDGLHRLNYRIKDARGAWSQTVTSYFLKRTNIPDDNNVLSTLEYWWDNDYSAHVQTTVSQDALIAINEAGDVSTLSDGIHCLSFRVNDSRNQGSSVETYAFVKYGENFPEPEIQMNDGKIYQVFNARLTWYEADDLCKRFSGRLAVPETASDSTFIVSLMHEHPNVNYYWLGRESNYYADNRAGNNNLQCNRLSDNQEYPYGNATIGFILEKELDGVGSLEAVLPATASNGAYKNMTLELRKDSTHFSITTTSKLQYRFNGVPNGVYDLTLKNKFGSVLGQIDSIVIKDKRLTNVTFDNLATVYTVRLNIIGGQNLSGNPQVKWYDSNDNFLTSGDTIAGVAAGMALKYQLSLNETWGKIYLAPPAKEYTVIAGNNLIQDTLQEIPQITITGKVKAEDGGYVSGAVITVSQMLNGKYSQITTGKTDRNGNFAVPAHNDSTTIAVSYSGYLNKTISRSNFNDAITNDTTDLGLIALAKIEGATIALNLTYTPSATTGDAAATENWYSDYQNVDYALYNLTQGKTIENALVQYPNIVLLDSVGISDEIRITATSRLSAFKAVQDTLTLDTLLRATAQLDIVQYGSVKAVYVESGNSSNAGILYNSAERRINKYVYSGNTLQTGDLPDGDYQLVSMANSSFFNDLSNLSSFAAAGLVQNRDYVQQTIAVESGRITEVNVPSIPALNESQWYYTGANTKFSVNKPTVTAGNYLTLRSEIDFKAEHRAGVSNVKLIVEMPEHCEFIYSSVMVGNAISAAYTFADNRLTLPLANYADIVKFCVIPTQGGDYSPNAFVQFDLNGQTVLQPLGAAPFKVENMTMTVPNLTAHKTIPVHGVTTANSEIKVYDGDMLIGQTGALANGSWSLQADLYKPYALSFHNIHAEANTPQGLTLVSDVREITHNISAIEVSKVTMINVAHPSTSLDLCEYVTVFDFQNPTNVSQNYWYWPNYPDFTFKIEFTSSDTTKISNVDLYVKTSSKNIVKLPTTYDGDKGIWTATGKFYSNSLPVNVSVDYLADDKAYLDRNYVYEARNEYDEISEQYQQQIHIIDSVFSDDYNGQGLDSLLLSLGLNRSEEEKAYMQYLSGLTNEELDVLIEQDVFNVDSQLLDSLNNNIETLKELFTVDKYFETHLPEGTSIISKTCDGLTDISLVEMGYERYETVEGSYIYTYTSDNHSDYVDLDKNLFISIERHNTEQTQLRSVETDIDDFIKVIKTIRGTYEPIVKAYSNLEKRIGNLVIRLEKDFTEFDNLYEIQNKAYLKKDFRLQRAIQELDELDPSDMMYGLNKLRLEEQIRKLDIDVKGLKEAVNTIQKNRILAKSCWYISKKIGPQLNVVCPLIKYADAVAKSVYIVHQFVKLYNEVPKECEKDQQKANDCRTASVLAGTYIGGLYATKLGVDALMDLAAAGQVVASPATGGASLGTAFLTVLTKMVASIAIENLFDWEKNRQINQIKSMIASLDCHKDDDDDNDDDEDDDDDDDPPTPPDPPCEDCPDPDPDPNPNPDPNPGGGTGGNGGGKSGNSGSADVTDTQDPSGYVYEAVPSNRLQDVTASVYYETEEENIYGECIKKVVLWDAENYEQVNPQTTDAFGQYSWFVPQGLWQVKYEKDGYETTYSDWLPVPPPQLDVNIAMTQAVQPEVISAKGYESGIKIEFDKFMLPATLTVDSVSVTRNGALEQGVIEFLNIEDALVSKIRFVPATPFSVSDEVILTVEREVESYAGIGMAEDFVQRIPIEKEVQSILAPAELNLVLNETEIVDVSATPQEVARNRKLFARTVASSIASVTRETVLDANGAAWLEVSGELPGSTVLYVSIDSTDLKSEISINVFMPNTLRLEKPLSSFASGTTVAKDTEIALLTDKAGAKIYYTLNDSVPTAATATEYTQPIVITDSVTIKAIAVKEGYLDSRIAAFTYLVDTGNGIESVSDYSSPIVYPNPTNGMLYIKDKTDCMIKVYNIWGELLASIRSSKVDMSKFTAGIYLLQIDNEFVKVIKE